MSVKALRKILIGQSDSASSHVEVDATTIWRGEGVFEDLTEVVFVPEDVGYISGVDRTYIANVGGQINLTDTPATFEQIGYILAAGVIDETSGSADGAGSDYIYVYPMPTTAANTLQYYTIEAGDDQQAEVMNHCFVESFSLSGAAGEALMMSATLLGDQIATTTFTATADDTLPAVEEILFSKGKLYIDDATGTVGSTLASNTFLAMNLNVTTGWHPVRTADGNLYFSFAKSTMPEVMLDITFEHDTTAVASIADWRAQTAQVLRLIWTGSAVTTGGTTYSVKTFLFDIAGKWESFDGIGEQDGNDIIVGHFRGRYSADAVEFCTFTVVNEIAALP